jgi:Glycosyltransferase family 87
MLTPGRPLTYLPIIVVVILLFYGASWQIFWPSTDAARYQCYALTFWSGSHATAGLPASQCLFLHAPAQGLPPFRLLPLEYPPLTIVLFSLALFAPLAYYQVLFACWMALAALLIYWLLLRYGPRGAALTFAIYALVGAWATAEGRFDLVPAALTLLCIIAADRKRWTVAYIALALGVLLKIYPLLLLPTLFIAEQRDLRTLPAPASSLSLGTLPAALWQTVGSIRHWRWKNSLIFLGLLLGVTGVFALFSFYGAVQSQLSYFVGRPVQIESTGSSFLWLATALGFPARVVFTYGSVNIVSGLDGVVSWTGEVAFALGYAYAIWTQWRGRSALLQTSIAILLVFIVTNKVFSPQYLIWIMPLLAYSFPLERFWLLSWITISLLTTIIYPYLYMRTSNALLVAQVPGFIEIVAIRNTLLVSLTLSYLFNWFQVFRRRALIY